jgi:hypothetical protein
MVLAYDYTVLAGTQGGFNHKKKDRMFEIADKLRIPIIFFAEGGGGRPGDTDVAQSSNLTLRTFETFGRLSGNAPMIGITTGYCFAGNAVILGTCDIIIATEGSNIGIGGPAMVEGGEPNTLNGQQPNTVNGQRPAQLTQTPRPQLTQTPRATADTNAPRHRSGQVGWACSIPRRSARSPCTSPTESSTWLPATKPTPCS